MRVGAQKSKDALPKADAWRMAFCFSAAGLCAYINVIGLLFVAGCVPAGEVPGTVECRFPGLATLPHIKQ